MNLNNAKNHESKCNFQDAKSVSEKFGKLGCYFFFFSFFLSASKLMYIFVANVKALINFLNYGICCGNLLCKCHAVLQNDPFLKYLEYSFKYLFT